MKIYRITEQRDGQMAKNYKNGMTLREAQQELLKMANYDLEANYPNWGLLVAATRNKPASFSASCTLSDGTRSYNYDVYTYRIESEQD